MAEDDDRITRKLGTLEEYMKAMEDAKVSTIARYKSLGGLEKAGVERYLQLINDTQLEVLALLYKKLYPGMPANLDAALEKLRNDMNKQTVDSFDERRKLRNRLVHAYIGTRYDNEVFAQSNNLKDVKDFIKEVKRIVGHKGVASAGNH